MTQVILPRQEIEKISSYLFDMKWNKIPELNKKELWKRMCEDRLFDSLEISGINEICQIIEKHNKENGQQSELRCFLHSENDDISIFYVKYGAQYGNSWFNYRTLETMESIGGGWEIPMLFIFRKKELINIYHLPEEIYDLTKHELGDGNIFFTGRFRFFEYYWILDRNGNKIGESERLDVSNQIIFSISSNPLKPILMQKIHHKGTIISSSISVKWEI